jgi:hypothetical protein
MTIQTRKPAPVQPAAPMARPSLLPTAPHQVTNVAEDRTVHSPPPRAAATLVENHRVTDRDLVLIDALRRYDKMTYRQIALLLKCDVSAAGRRARKLISLGLLAMCPWRPNGQILVALDRKGQEMAGLKPRTPTWPTGTFLHTYWVAEAGRSIERAGATPVTDVLLRRALAAGEDPTMLPVVKMPGGHHIPDLVTPTRDGGEVAWEIELSRKSDKDLLRILTAYAKDDQIKEVHYRVATEAIASAVKRAAKQARAADKVRIELLPADEWAFVSASDQALDRARARREQHQATRRAELAARMR